jgi:hypothetical protein
MAEKYEGQLQKWNDGWREGLDQWKYTGKSRFAETRLAARKQHRANFHG